MNPYTFIALFALVVFISLYLHERKKPRAKTKNDAFTAAINTTSSYYPLFEHLAKEHNLILVESELQEITTHCQVDTNKVVHELLCAMDIANSNEINGVEYYVWKNRNEFDSDNDDALKLIANRFVYRNNYLNAIPSPLDGPIYDASLNSDLKPGSQYLAKGLVDPLNVGDWMGIKTDQVNEDDECLKYRFEYNGVTFYVEELEIDDYNSTWGYYVNTKDLKFNSLGYKSKEVAMFEALRHYKMHFQNSKSLRNIM